MASVKHLSTPALIKRMEQAHEDQNLDDETLELTNRLDKRGKDWYFRYVPGVGHRIIVEDK